jgi:nitroreductase
MEWTSDKSLKSAGASEDSNRTQFLKVWYAKFWTKGDGRPPGETHSLGNFMSSRASHSRNSKRRILPDAENKLMVAGIALGYPDREAPINHFERERTPLDEIVTWVK